ncbi:Uncharacterised protein [Bordetella pertussis]|nr:Uncharacterised protein [Bordetella pertussis]
MPQCGSTSTTSRPLTTMRPAVGRSNPVIRLSSVDFPQPEAPSTTRNSPRGIFRSTPCSA